MNYLSDLADQIKTEVPDRARPDDDDELLFLVYAVLLLDRLALPVLFLYRQYLELALKTIIVRGGRSLPQRPAINHHNLTVLWDQSLKMADQVWPGSAQQHDTKAVRRALDILMKLDPTSTAARYPQASGMKSKLLPTNFRFDIRHLANQMEKLRNYLGATFDGVDHAMKSSPYG